MRVMKKYNISLLVLAILLASCGESFLYKNPQGSVDKESLTNPNGVELLVTNAYGVLTADNAWGATVFNWVFGGIYGGDANKGSDSNDQSVLNTMEMYAPLPTNSYLNDKWVWVYKGSNRVNTALKIMAEVTDMPDKIKTIRTGELKFMRALCYFEGVKVFGPMIPWVDETVVENNPLIANDKNIYPLILAELDEAIEKLPEVQDMPGRANVWAAKALKAKVLMQMGKLKEAKPILADVIQNGQTSNGLKYELEDDLNANFDSFRDNGKESIFAVQFSADTNDKGNYGMGLCYPHGGAGNPGGCCGFYQPSNELANSFKVDENGLPFLDKSYREGKMVSYLNPNPGKEDPMALNNDVAVDPRLDFAIGRFGIPYKDWGEPKNNWVRDVSNGGFYMPKKHVYTRAEQDAGLADGGLIAGWAPGSAMNLQYLSLRDCILLYAECLAEDGELSAAMEQVNRIRERAAHPKNIIMKDGKPAANYLVKPYPASHAAFSDKEICIKAIRMERKLELAMEGQRWFDLSRWGGTYMSKTLKEYVEFEKRFISKFASASVLSPEKTMFPLPDTQVLNMGVKEDGTPYLVQPAPWQ